jgi:hypothetical protein
MGTLIGIARFRVNVDLIGDCSRLASKEKIMALNIRKIPVLLASLTLAAAFTLAISAPSAAQGWHQGGNDQGRSQSWHQGGNDQGHSQGWHQGGNDQGRSQGWHQGGNDQGRSQGWHQGGDNGWQHDPHYAHHSWAWYRRHSAGWRHEHPYHGSPTLGIVIRL